MVSLFGSFLWSDVSYFIFLRVANVLLLLLTFLSPLFFISPHTGKGGTKVGGSMVGKLVSRQGWGLLVMVLETDSILGSPEVLVVGLVEII